jgi:putative MATE family efflux protein
MDDDIAGGCAGAPGLSTVPGATIGRQVLWLAAPVLVEQSLLYLVGLSDTIVTGRYLAAEHLAAVTVSTYLLWFLGSLLTIVSVGATALVARFSGANQPESAARIAQQAIAMALIVGVVTAVVGWLGAPGVVRILNLEGASAAAAVRFLRIVLAVTPLLACTTAGVACLRGVGDTRTGMWVMMSVNAINVGLCWPLVRGLGPLPSLGLDGVAVGTASGEAVGGLIVLGILARGRSGLRIGLPGLVPAWDDIRRILRISLPAAGESLSNIFCQLWFLGLINRLGPVATAAHGVAIRCEAIAFLTVSAFSVAAITLNGQYLGAGRDDLAARAASTAWGLGVAVLSTLGVLIYVEAAPMFELFVAGRQPGVVALGVPVLRVVAFAMPALATINVVNGALRGAGDTRWPWAIVLFGYLAVRLPLTYLLATPSPGDGPAWAPGLAWGWGLYGAWIAMFADLNVRGALIALRFLHGGWRRSRV